MQDAGGGRAQPHADHRTMARSEGEGAVRREGGEQREGSSEVWVLQERKKKASETDAGRAENGKCESILARLGHPFVAEELSALAAKQQRSDLI